MTTICRTFQSKVSWSLPAAKSPGSDLGLPTSNSVMSGTGKGKRAELGAQGPLWRMQKVFLKKRAKEVREDRTRRGKAEAQLQKSNSEQKPGTPSKGLMPGTPSRSWFEGSDEGLVGLGPQEEPGSSMKGRSNLGGLRKRRAGSGWTTGRAFRGLPREGPRSLGFRGSFGARRRESRGRRASYTPQKLQTTRPRNPI